jgi:hypothetical protein
MDEEKLEQSTLIVTHNKFISYEENKVLWLSFFSYRHLSNIDCLTVRTACLVCFISTVNGRSKKRSLGRLALVAGTLQSLSNLFWRLSISMFFSECMYVVNSPPKNSFIGLERFFPVAK